MKKILLFDWDGVLVDTMFNHTCLATECICKNFKVSEEEVIKKYTETTGLPFDNQLEMIFPNEKKYLKENCAKEYHKRKIVDVYSNFKEFPEVVKVLEKIKEKKDIVIIISSGTEENIINNWVKKHNLGLEVFGKESGLKENHISKIKKNLPNRKNIFISDSILDMKLPVDISLGVNVSENEKDIFFDGGAEHVYHGPISFSWLNTVKDYLFDIE
ncbi:MAG: HAD hydrolase-like protein [Candidatus Paceibacterota bacterium]|jgi:phosphoglycolate phosphatase-like HAD superfamily hydrolase